MTGSARLSQAFGVSKSRVLAAPFAAAYYLVQKSRELAYRSGVVHAESAPIPVISVGNVVMGGAGKTPLTMCLAQGLLRRGLKPAVVSRGYKGSYRAPFLVVRGPTGPLKCRWEECGDEPALLADRLEGVPVIAARKRLLGVRAASDEFNCDCAVLDDGFQHLSLLRNLDIVALSGHEDRMFPMGELREPLSALTRAHAFVCTGFGEVPPRLTRIIRGRPLFRATAEPIEVITVEGRRKISSLRNKSLFLIAGIARPERFLLTVTFLGAEVKRFHVFPDHHPLREEELSGIFEEAGADWVLFTEKDWVKLPQRWRERRRTGALRIGVRIDDEDSFWPIVLRACRGAEDGLHGLRD
jgi:tetraacyldisaccharide 4'-kinase